MKLGVVNSDQSLASVVLKIYEENLKEYERNKNASHINLERTLALSVVQNTLTFTKPIEHSSGSLKRSDDSDSTDSCFVNTQQQRTEGCDRASRYFVINRGTV